VKYKSLAIVALHRALTLFPLWSVVVGVVLGTIVGDVYGLNRWHFFCGFSLVVLVGVFFSRFFESLTSVWRCKSPIFLTICSFLLALGLHGYQVDRQRLAVGCLEYLSRSTQSLTEQQSTLPRADVRVRGIVIDTGVRGDGPYLIKVSSLRLASSPSIQENFPTGVRVEMRKGYTRAKVFPATLSLGDIVDVCGVLERVPALRNPHGFDRAKWRHRQGVDLQLLVYSKVDICGVSLIRIPAREMISWRAWIREKIVAGLAPDSDPARLICAVVLGERPSKKSNVFSVDTSKTSTDSDEENDDGRMMIDDFRESGTLHVFAVSGLHVGMVGALLAFFLWFLRVPRWLMILLTILGIIVYAGVTGFRPPAVRAVIMATIFLSGFLFLRMPTLINSLGASAIVVLLWDGHQLFTPGFQLSYGVLLAIALLTFLWMKLFAPIATLDPFMPRELISRHQEWWLKQREKFQGALAVSCAAWVGSSPLIWYYFGLISPVAILAGIALMSLVFMLLALAMISLVLGVIWTPLGVGVNHANALLAQATHSTAAWFADWPMSHYYRKPSPPKGGRITVFDLPEGGGSSLLEVGGGVLIDSGRSDCFRYDVLPYLDYLRLSPDSLVLTHADVKHVGAMGECLLRYHSKQALIPRKDLRSPRYRGFLSRAEMSGCRLITPVRRQRFLLDEQDEDTVLEVLQAPAEFDAFGRADDAGLVLRFHWRGWRILFMGDAGFKTENRLLNQAENGLDIRADIIVMGRNAYDITGGIDFLKKVHPRVIISSNAPFPAYEKIPTKWKRELSELDIFLFDQGVFGAITMTVDENRMILSPMLSDLEDSKISPDKPLILTR